MFTTLGNVKWLWRRYPLQPTVVLYTTVKKLIGQILLAGLRGRRECPPSFFLFFFKKQKCIESAKNMLQRDEREAGKGLICLGGFVLNPLFRQK